MAKKRNPTLDYLVYLVVRIVVCIVQSMPIEWGYALARLIARIGYRVDRRHRDIAVENLRHAYGDQMTPEQRHAMVRGVYEHFARMIIEIAFIPRKLHRSNWKKYVHLEECRPAVRALLSNRPSLIVTAHFGNWEMAGFFLSAVGLQSFAIARVLDNPHLHQFLLRFRQWSGQTILSKTGDFDKIEQVLRDKQVLVSVGDQSAGPRGYFVDFFGRPASTHKAIALLAIEHDAPILIGYAFRDRPGFHYTVSCPVCLDPRDYADRKDPPLAMTADFTAELEAAIRRAPEQYLWLHNRWKHDPPPAKGKKVKAAA